MSVSRIREILARSTAGVLSLLDENGYTYGVPMSYLLRGNTIYFHCATVGAKLDALRHHNKVSFTVIDQDRVIPEEYTTQYRSVIVFGTARLVTDTAELSGAIRDLAHRYAPGVVSACLEPDASGNYTDLAMIALDIDHMTGKESRS